MRSRLIVPLSALALMAAACGQREVPRQKSMEPFSSALLASGESSAGDASNAAVDHLALPIEAGDLVALSRNLKARVNLRAIRIQVMNLINQERTSMGLKPLLADGVGEKAADLHALEEVQAGHWLSHYSLNGDLPYMRFSKAGGYDGNSENAAVMSISADVETTGNPNIPAPCRRASAWPKPSPDNIQNVIAEMALSLQCQMFNEQAPHDGHRRTTLAPHATSVGVSVGVQYGDGTNPATGGAQISIYLVEEFETRGLKAVQPVPLNVNYSGERSVMFAGELDANHTFNHAMLYYEKLIPKTVKEAGSVLHYQMPGVFALLVMPPQAGSDWPDDLKSQFKDIRNVVKMSGDVFSMPLEFTYGPGVYTVQVIAQEKSSDDVDVIASRSVFVAP